MRCLQNFPLFLEAYFAACSLLSGQKKNVMQLLSFFMIRLGFLQCAPKPWGNSHLLKQ